MDNEEQDSQSWLNVVGSAVTNPVAKSVILAVVPTVLSALWTLAVASAPSDGSSSSLSVALFVGAIVVSVLYLGYVITLGIFEHRRKREVAELERLYREAARNQNALVVVTRDIKEAHRDLSETANEELHRIRDGGQLMMTTQGFESFCKTLCGMIRDMMVMCFAKGLSVDVGYVRLCEEVDGDTICLCAHAGDDSPKILTQHRKISRSKKAYLDQRLFAKGRDSITVILKQKKLADSFKWRADADRGKYLQFVAIPVFCRRGHDASPKMVGLLELTARKGSFGEDKDEVRDAARKFVEPYCFLILAAYKMYKGMQLAGGAGEGGAPQA